MDAPENDGNVSMPEQVKQPNPPWRNIMMMKKVPIEYHKNNSGTDKMF